MKFLASTSCEKFENNSDSIAINRISEHFFLNVKSSFTLGKILIRRRSGQRELCRLPQLYHLALLYVKYSEIQYRTVQ